MEWLANISIEWVIVLVLGLAALRIGIVYLGRAQTIPEGAASSAGEFVESALIAIVLVFLIIRPFIVQAFYIPSGSMHPTLLEDDHILVNKFIYRFSEPKHGDVVVFKSPKEVSADEKPFIKRLIGLPGDEIKVEEGKTYRNGKPLTEPYILEEPVYPFGPAKVPPGKLFVMGDNRNNSNDSHEWGMLDRDRVLGKAMLIFWPLSRMRIIR
ncbi:MAG: signal peptidase I [Armatimonadetes bacterium]|nr:signal peptidase I [Armatimonadota bacterium]